MAMLDENLRQMLRELGRALSHAIAESPEVGETLRRIESEGYSLHLVLDCKRDGAGAAATPAPPPPTGGEPAFRINGDDLFFLRSCGIDPTRRRRRTS